MWLGDKDVYVYVHMPVCACMPHARREERCQKQPGSRTSGFLNNKLRSFTSSGRRYRSPHPEETREPSYSFKQRNERIRFCFRKIILAVLWKEDQNRVRLNLLYKLNILQYTFEHIIALSNYEILPSLRPTHTEQIFSIKIRNSSFSWQMDPS